MHILKLIIKITYQVNYLEIKMIRKMTILIPILIIRKTFQVNYFNSKKPIMKNKNKILNQK